MTGRWARWWGGRPRVRGAPTSRTGASSFHLWWVVPSRMRAVEASVVLEVVDPPVAARLVFWALQVSFAGPEGGGAHLGLQWNPRFPGGTAVNWGGYAPDGSLLAGSPSPLPSTPEDPNTRDLLWYARRPYRLRVVRLPDRPAPDLVAWRGIVEDLEAEESWVVRELWSPGTWLRGPVVWTESFQDCDAPSFAVRWSEPRLVGDDGEVYEVGEMAVDYQRREAGGCDNTDSSVDDVGWVQRTNVPRRRRAGSRLAPGPG